VKGIGLAAIRCYPVLYAAGVTEREHKPRTKVVMVRMTESAYASVSAEAARLGLSRSELLRESLLFAWGKLGRPRPAVETRAEFKP